MQIITTTELRTKSKDLVKTLKEGRSVKLIHKSKIVGEVKPNFSTQKPFSYTKFIELLEQIRPIKVIDRADRDKVYRANLEEKHGKSIH